MTYSQSLSVAPLLVPLATVLLTTLLAAHPRRQRVASLLGALFLLLVASVLLYGTADGHVYGARFGDWAAPFAIEFRIDRVGALLLASAALLSVLALGYAWSSHSMPPLALPLLHGLLAGVGGAYATADLFNLYVWFEVMLIAALGLLVAARRPQHLEAGMKYLVLNMLGTVLLLVAVAGLYGITGQLNYAALGEALAQKSEDPLALLLLGLLVIALLLKAGAFPFFFWLPGAYPVLPIPLLALFTALTTKVGAYAVLRVYTEIVPAESHVFATGLGWIAVATMLVGVLGAVYHYDIRRILAFHSVSQMGYILLAIALGGAVGTAAALFFIVHHILVKSNLYLIGGMIAHSGGFDLRRLGGIYRTQPALALLFGVTAAGLVGIPPLSGFWAKLLIVRESFAQSEYVWGAVALATGGLTLLSMVKIWSEAFWKRHPDAPAATSALQSPLAWLATCMLALLVIAIGAVPGPLLEFLNSAAQGMETTSPGVAR